MSATVALVNLGCRVNRVELDAMASELESLGFEIASADRADAIVVNTCAVTGEAEAKTRKALRRMVRRQDAPLVVATGCVATLFADSLHQVSDAIVVEPDKARVAHVVVTRLAERAVRATAGDTAASCGSVTPTGRTRPGIKVQDGCDQRCTYCIVWKARGPSRSVAADVVVSQANEAVERGASEIVLTGINLGRYDEGGLRIDGLVRRLIDECAVPRIRLSSIEPNDVTDELLELMGASDGRVAPFLHVCLQSGCTATLRRMGRPYDAAFFADVCDRARSHVPGIALETDLIVGFPGETDEEFEESLALCERMRFARMHVFRYSKRPGTPAATAKGQVAPPIANKRSAQARALACALRTQEIRSHLGEVARVVVEDAGHGTDGHLFDVVVDERLRTGSLVSVRLLMGADGVLRGEVAADG